MSVWVSVGGSGLNQTGDDCPEPTSSAASTRTKTTHETLSGEPRTSAVTSKGKAELQASPHSVDGAGPSTSIGIVRVDGVFAAEVNLYSAQAGVAQVHVTPTLSSGEHRISFEVSGRRDPRSGSNTINIDRVEYASTGTAPIPPPPTTPSPPSTVRQRPLFLSSGPRFATYAGMPAQDGLGTWLANNGDWSAIGTGMWLAP